MIAPGFTYTIEATCPETGARAGLLSTPHGVIRTPIFMPVATRASVRGLMQSSLYEMDADIILANTYHLYLRPGPELIRDFGGLHGFMKWDRPIITDSGGFQVYSLARTRKITEEGATFASILDGSRHLLTPERAMEIQHDLGADIIMAFDECAPSGYSWHEARRSMDRTHRWLDRSIARHRELQSEGGAVQALFSIVQGGVYPDLKKISAEYCASSDTAGVGIGGDLKIETDPYSMYELIADLVQHLPREKPRYLMGAGAPENLIESLALGVDMWDCVLPTRIGRHGAAFTREGRINVRGLRYRAEQGPLDPHCDCMVCRTYSAGYIRHLMTSEEMLGGQLLSYHNLSFLLQLVRRARQSILDGAFPTFLKEFREVYKGQHAKKEM